MRLKDIFAPNSSPLLWRNSRHKKNPITESGNRLCDLETYFLTYDELRAEEFWKINLEKKPSLKRMHGVSGFDSAHKACALASEGNRFVTVDGDNLLRPDFLNQYISKSLLSSSYVLSWSSSNLINGLAYGNGGVKCWPKKLVLDMKTHENSLKEKPTIDFYDTLKYYQMPEVLSDCDVSTSPYQAFRAGFREGIKLGLHKGQPVAGFWPKSNRERLRIWCSVGADINNGLWAMLGARLGCWHLLIDGFDCSLLNSHDWISFYWKENIYPYQLSIKSSSESWLNNKLFFLERTLNRELHLEITTLSKSASIFFKSNYQNPNRHGVLN